MDNELLIRIAALLEQQCEMMARLIQIQESMLILVADERGEASGPASITYLYGTADIGGRRGG